MDKGNLESVCKTPSTNTTPVKQETVDGYGADEMAEAEMLNLQVAKEAVHSTIDELNLNKQELNLTTEEHVNNMEEEVEDNSTAREEVEVRTVAVSNKGLPCSVDEVKKEQGTAEEKVAVDGSAEKSQDTATEMPLFEVRFQQSSVFKKYGWAIMGALRQALNKEDETLQLTVVNEESSDGMIIRAFKDENLLVPTINILTSEVAKKSGPPEREQSPDFTGLSELFTIDTEPAPILDTAKVPSYKRVIKEALDEQTAKRKKTASDDICSRPRPVSSCFNCGGTGHGVRDCPKPRSAKRINRAMKAFSTKQERYHIDIEQRFAHVQVGHLSENLKRALGLRRGEMPFFFYRMRLLGYPPGWMEDAKVASSGISLFSSDGVEVLRSDEDEGEVNSANYKIDASKIHEFPGFNTYPEGNYFDDYIQHNVPPMTANHMKDEFIKSLGDRVAKRYKRKKLKDLPGTHPIEKQSTTTLQVADMDIDDPGVLPDETTVIFTRPPPPVTEPPSLPPPPDLPATSIPSPSLRDLEAEQQKLKELLSVDNSNSNDSLTEKAIALTDVDMTTTESAAKQEDRHSSSPASPSTPAPTKTNNSAIIKESHMGTPVLQFSPFDKLPVGDNFKVGVSDVINFENLPDSTGMYEQMKVVIKKVRHQITKLQKEDD